MKIDFLLLSALEVSHFGPVVRALHAMDVDAQFVSPQTDWAEGRFGWDPPFVIDDLLLKESLPFRKSCRWTEADGVITTQCEKFVHAYKGKKGRMMYGVGLAPPSDIRLFNVPFDFHLVHGPLTSRIQFSEHGWASPNLSPDRVREIGYPRFDVWWREYCQPRPLPKTGIEVLYLPTWSDEHSSVDRFAETIAALPKPEFRVSVKPHHGIVHHQHDKMKKLRDLMNVIDYTESPALSFARADIVLADIASGACSEAILLRKPVVALGKTYALDYTGLSVCTNAVMLEYQLRGTLRLNPPHDDLRRDLFTTTEGHDAEVAAKAIVEFVS